MKDSSKPISLYHILKIMYVAPIFVLFVYVSKPVSRRNTADLSAVLCTSNPEEMYLLKSRFELSLGSC